MTQSCRRYQIADSVIIPQRVPSRPGRNSAIRRVRKLDQSSITPLALIAPAHLAISFSTKFCRYWDVLRSGETIVKPISVARCWTEGVFNVATVASWSFCTIDVGAPLGRKKPYQLPTSKLDSPCSWAEGKAGKIGERSFARIAIAFTFLLSICG